MATGGESAVAELGASWGPEVLRAVTVRIGVILSMNAPFTSAEMQALDKIYTTLWKVDAGFPPGGFFP
jgi:hypothetical protein